MSRPVNRNSPRPQTTVAKNQDVKTQDVKTQEAKTDKPAWKTEYKNGKYTANYKDEFKQEKSWSKSYGDAGNVGKAQRQGGALSLVASQVLPDVSTSGTTSKSYTAIDKSVSYASKDGTVQASANAKVLDASYTATGTAQFKDGVASANFKAEAQVVALDANAQAKVGNSTVNAQVNANVTVGAEVKANGSVTVDPARGIYAAQAGVDAFAGARVGVEATANVGPASVTGRAEAWAGVGATAKVTAGIDDGKIKAKLDLGAALGIGGKISVGFEFDVKGAAQSVGNFFRGLFN